jgi:hypothetical protein
MKKANTEIKIIPVDYLNLIKTDLKLDFAKTCLIRWDSNFYESEFDIIPKEFLRFAKADFKENNVKGFINALTNAKRAIDCQIDTVLNILGINFDKLSPAVDTFIKFSDLSGDNLPQKLKLFSALDFAPSGLISNIRTLRNKLEHYYEKPTPKDVKDALELSELFLLAVESKLSPFQEGFVLTDTLNHDYDEKDYRHHIINGLRFEYNSKKGCIEMQIIRNKTYSKTIKLIDQKVPEYYFLIKLLNNFNDDFELLNSLTLFLRFLKHPIPEKNIKVTRED